MGHFTLQNGLFCTVKWAVLDCEMGCFATRCVLSLYERVLIAAR